MRAGEIMSKPAITCRATDSVAVAAGLMWHYDCGAVAVVDDGNRLVGIVTDRDACMAAYTQGRAPGEIPVSTAMAQEVVACGPNDCIETVERLMRGKRVRRIPVVDNEDQLLGVVSLNDLVRASLHQGDLARRGVVETVSAIGSPRAVPTATRRPPKPARAPSTASPPSPGPSAH